MKINQQKDAVLTAFIKMSYINIMIILFSGAIVLLENSFASFLPAVIFNLIINETVIFACQRINANNKLLICIILINQIGITIQCIISKSILKNMILSLVGIIAAFIFIRIYIHIKSFGITAKYQKTIFISDILTYILMFIFGSVTGGSKAWISVGAFTIQFSEFTKLLFIAYFSLLIIDKELPEKKKHKRFLAFLLINSLGLALINELGTMLVLLILYLIMNLLYFKSKYFLVSILLISLFLSLAVLIYNIIISYISSTENPNNLIQFIYNFAVSKIETRINIWLHPDVLGYDETFQINQARNATIFGGLSGSTIQNAIDIPVAESDFVFISIILNLGLITGFFVVALFFIFLLLGIKSCINLKNSFESSASCGCVCCIFVSSLLMILGSTNMFLLTGVPIAFLSSGGTTTAVTYVMTAFILYSSAKNRKRCKRIKCLDRAYSRIQGQLIKIKSKKYKSILLSSVNKSRRLNKNI